MLILRNTNIHNNTPGNGLNVASNSTAVVRATTIQDHGCAGLTTCFIDFGGGVGVFVARSSTVSLRENTVIQNNGNFGILARLLSTVGLEFGPPNTLTTVQGHNITGIFIQEGAHLQVNGTSLVQGNDGGCPHDTPIPCGGIFATENATLEFGGFGTVSGNQWSGIFVEQGTNLHLGGGVTVSNNSGDGVHIQRISIGDFTPIPGASSPPNTITGNGGASVFCDARSLAHRQPRRLLQSQLRAELAELTRRTVCSIGTRTARRRIASRGDPEVRGSAETPLEPVLESLGQR